MKKLNLRIPTYEFKIQEDSFKTTKVPTAMYINNITKIWNNYEKYGMMKNIEDRNNIDNPRIVERLAQDGIIEINMVKDIFGKKYPSLILNEDPIKNLEKDLERKRLFDIFFEEKLKNPYVGIFIKELDGIILELDWLPIPARKLVNIEAINEKEIVRSFNIYHENESAYLVSFLHTKTNNLFELSIEQIFKIGESELFYDQMETFAPIRIIEISEFLPNNKINNIVEAWDMFYVARYEYFLGEHPYSTKLDPVYPDKMDKLRMFLIWLNRLQEYIGKLEILHKQSKTVILTGKHNEMNGEFVSYNTTYTPEIRNEILSKKENYQLYAIANDWYL